MQGTCKFYQNVLYLSCDGVITDGNGLICMRARYYLPDMRRFINADVVAGDISNAITLNRFAYANGNPVSNIDPFGLSVDWGNVAKAATGIVVLGGLAVATFFAAPAVAAITGAALVGATVSAGAGAAIG